MRKNSLLEQIRKGETAYGMGLGLPHYSIAEALARLGYQWFYIDGQHYPLSYNQMSLLTAAIWANGATPIIRVPWFGVDHIQQALDAGAGGVMVPVVNTADEAKAVVRVAKFPPRGIRSKGGTLHAAAFNTDTTTYYAQANNETLISVQLETREAIINAEEILNVDGIDVVSIGPNDLAASFGYAEVDAWAHEEFVNAIESVVAAAERTGKVAGINTRTAAKAREWAAAGFRMISIGNDLGMLTNAAAYLAEELGLR